MEAPLEEVGLFSAGPGEVPIDMATESLRWWNLSEGKRDTGDWRPVMVGGGREILMTCGSARGTIPGPWL